MDLRNAHILVVDDHQPMREILKSLLFSLGARKVSEAASARAALEHLMLNNVTLVLTDHDLGGTTGVELVRAIRRDPAGRNRRVPIVMVSGRAEPGVILAARDAGVNEFLVKPLTAKAMVQKVTLALGSPRPFVDTPAYAGPERRRRDLGQPAIERRRSAAARSA